ncbi:MAG: ethanolamine ammonia-lyase reactivating factor EutA, partial [Syntrophaceae bacterium]|nr:ethanolamine ammonia-lyase reactivating factor EutA [Syntrophaceae bacterium]
SAMVTNHGLERYRSADMIDIFTFSGGVADCIYKADDFDALQFGDIGVWLGKALRASRFFSAAKVEVPAETIRATVVGAGNHSMDVSGSTILYSNISFPLLDIPIVKVQLACPEDIGRLEAELKDTLLWYKGREEDTQVAVSMKGLAGPTFEQIEAMAEAVKRGMCAEIEAGRILLVILERDQAKALGQALERRLPQGVRLLCLDGIEVGGGDYIDIGEPLMSGRVLPVVVKTLMFG